MTKVLITFLFLLLFADGIAQSINPFPIQKMKKDFAVFKEIRIKANSGLYKYRSKQQIDSMYTWAERAIEESATYLDFYNIIAAVTDFEGSLHNNTRLPTKYLKNQRKESTGYFPYPIKWVDGKWRINFANGGIPLGAELIAINQVPMPEIVQNLSKYYTTDGINLTGKRIGLRTHFARYYRWHYGLTKEFEVVFRLPDSDQIDTVKLESVGYVDYYRNFNSRYSKPYDQRYYADLGENEKYAYDQIDVSTGKLTIHTFAMGSESTEEHKRYSKFLDSLFTVINAADIKNLIVDVRQNGGGTNPNDLVTYSYLTQRDFQENIEAWISFKKIPLLRYIDFWLPKFLRPVFVGFYNARFRNEFPVTKNGRYYQDEHSDDHQVRHPATNAFSGNIYLLVSPAVASAGSLFAAMVAGNENTTTIGEETMGGYYGHNGHTSLAYKLPKSKMKISFSVVNLEQDVPAKANQSYNRGIIPDITVSQTYHDFLAHRDTQQEYTLSLIKGKKE